MADEKPGLHIDLDWKKQAQEEKRKLEEAEKKRAEEKAAQAAAPAAPVGVIPSAAGPGAMGGAMKGKSARDGKQIPEASIATLAASLASQAMYYMSDMAQQRGDEVANMDMAKHLIDSLTVLDAKTEGRLSDEERAGLDFALYQTRMRFIAVAGEVIAN